MYIEVYNKIKINQTFILLFFCSYLYIDVNISIFYFVNFSYHLISSDKCKILSNITQNVFGSESMMQLSMYEVCRTQKSKI